MGRGRSSTCRVSIPEFVSFKLNLLTRVAWPALGEVNTAATALQNAVNLQSTAKDAYDLGQETVSDQRLPLDVVVKDLWDTVEFNLRTEDASSLRRKAREWGVAYDGEEEEEPVPIPPTPPVP